MTAATLPPPPMCEAKPRVTPDDLLAMPEGDAYELVDGELVEKAVSVRSSEVELSIGRVLGNFLADHPIARVFPSSLGYRCFPGWPDRIRRPDVTVVLLERLARLDNPDPGLMPIVPDLAVEVVSRHDTVYHMNERVREYHEAGFPLVWIADPVLRTIAVHPRDGRVTMLNSDDDATAEAALPGFRCRVAELFPPTPTDVASVASSRS